MNDLKIEELFSSQNYWYWCTILVIFLIPIVLKIINKIQILFFMQKENFDVVISKFTDEYHKYSLFGKQTSYYIVEFEINNKAKSILKVEHDFDNKQVFKMPVSEDDYYTLKKIGLKNEIGLNAMFAKSRFGYLYFIKFNNKVNYKNVLQNIKNNKKHDFQKEKKKSNIITSQYDLQRKYMKDIFNLKAANDDKH